MSIYPMSDNQNCTVNYTKSMVASTPIWKEHEDQPARQWRVVMTIRGDIWETVVGMSRECGRTEGNTTEIGLL